MNDVGQGIATSQYGGIEHEMEKTMARANILSESTATGGRGWGSFSLCSEPQELPSVMCVIT